MKKSMTTMTEESLVMSTQEVGSTFRRGFAGPSQLNRNGSEQSYCFMTTLELAESEVLTHLERHGATSLRGLVRALRWPVPIVFLAVGALMRSHWVRGSQHELEIIVEPEAGQRVEGSLQ